MVKSAIMDVLMPSPIGHALAGLAIARSAGRSPDSVQTAGLPPRYLLILCIALAVVPDLDLIYHLIHRTVTHSFVAAAFVTIVIAAVTGWVTGRIDWRVTFVCGSAYLSHIALDWLGQDLNRPRGIQMLWPFSSDWFISGWDLFRATERARPFSLPTILHNARTAAQEVLTFAPILLALWLVRKSRVGKTTNRMEQ